MATETSGMGRRIKAARESLGLSQQELATKVGVHFISISRWELGKQAIGGASLVELARALGTSTEWLSTGEGPPPTYIREELSEYVSRGTPDDWTPNPALKSLLPSRAYDVAIAYCRRLQAAGVPSDEIETLERLLIDNRFGARDRRSRELTAEEQIMNIDVTWRIIQETLATKGVRV